METRLVVIRDDNTRHRAHQLVDALPLGFEVVGREHKSQRNLEQNSAYWAALEEIAAQATPAGEKFSKEIWHEHFARRYLPFEEKRLPGGSIALVRRSTKELNVREFSDFLTRVMADAATELDVRFSA